MSDCHHDWTLGYDSFICVKCDLERSISDDRMHVDVYEWDPADGDPVLACATWTSNAELIEEVARLYLDESMRALDPTYEKGVWWKKWRPTNLTTRHRAEDGSDFREMPERDGTYDLVAYDPPYVCPGGRKTSGLKDMHQRYGMAEGGFEDPEFSSPAELQVIIDDGLDEVWRVLVRGGVALVKCQNYVWSGHLWEGAERTREHALSLGFVVVDRLEHVGGVRPQPERTRKCPDCGGGGCVTCDRTGRVRSPQVHSRRNLSTLFVLRKPKRAPKPDQPTLL